MGERHHALRRRASSLLVMLVAASGCGPEVVAHTAPALTKDAGSPSGNPADPSAGAPAEPPTDAGAANCALAEFLSNVVESMCEADLDDPCARAFVERGMALSDSAAAIWVDGGAGEGRQLDRCDVVDFGYADEDRNVYVLCPQACQIAKDWDGFCTTFHTCEFADLEAPAMM